MKRSEAVARVLREIVGELYDPSLSREERQARIIVEALEALGLIRFDTDGGGHALAGVAAQESSYFASNPCQGCGLSDGLHKPTCPCRRENQTTKQEFREGDVVYLKTGSPPLVVEATRRDAVVAVSWFDGTKLCRDALHSLALTKEKSSCG